MRLTDLTRARTSPVVGHTLSKISPEPFHAPSYTPDNSSVVEMSKEDRIVVALVDKFLRASKATWRVSKAFLDNIV